VRRINELHLKYGREAERLFYLVDLSELENLEPQVRREASEVIQNLPLHGTAIYGATLKAKVLAKLMLTAARIMRGRDGNPVSFHDLESEARDWINERRRLG